jgi:uncharacterized membrane protein (UPF0127 family)
MALEKFEYYIDGKKKLIDVKKVSMLSFGLMFRRKSPALLFTLPKEMKFSIFSTFCKPFRAIWLDKNRHVVKTLDVKTWKYKIPGRGKFLLEIPLLTQKKGYRRKN